jgi:hypothetical protein
MTDRTKNLPKGLAIGTTEQTVTNPFSGESVLLKPDAIAVYDFIKGSEALKQYDDMREGLDWFMQHEPEAYMTLLD